MILSQKGITVLSSDFLSYNEPFRFDLVISNTPFSDGAKHFIKGWDYCRGGGQFVCLVNQNTIDNVCDSDRQIVQQLIKDNNGTVTNLGQCFKNSERPTDVEVAMVYMRKPEKAQSYSFQGIPFDIDPLKELEEMQNPLAMNQPIKNLVAIYNIAERIVIERYQSQDKLDFYLKGISSAITTSQDYDDSKHLSPKYSLESQIRALKSRFWNTVFDRTKMGSNTTSNFRTKFNEFSITQSTMAFTENNIMEVLIMFIGNKENIMQESLVEIFERATAYHEKNCIHSEGWKTNKSWKLGPRIIMPYGVMYNDMFGFEMNTYSGSFLQDLDKVIQWLVGKETQPSRTIYATLKERLKTVNNQGGEYKEKFESEHFHLRFFKKGTLWLDFKDQQLLDRLNKRAAEGKPWLPSDS
jgi:hypothetical protein